MRADPPIPSVPSYTLTSVADNHIYLKITGRVTRGRADEWTQHAHALGLKLGIHAYLIDVTEARNVETAMANYDFAYKDMKAPGIDRLARIAVLVSPDDHSHDFVETVAKNAGVNLTLFRDREAALRHLGVPVPSR